MGGVCERTEQSELHSHADGCGVAVTVPVAGCVDDDVGPSRRTCSFQCRHCYFSLKCHWIQSTCKAFFSLSSAFLWRSFFFSVISGLWLIGTQECLSSSPFKLSIEMPLMPAKCLMIIPCSFMTKVHQKILQLTENSHQWCSNDGFILNLTDFLKF